jgi:autotransporter-associated beta strand protein
MNRIYRLVWNRALRVLQVASELACTPGTGNAVNASTSPLRKHPLALACLAALALGTLASPAWAASCTVNGTSYDNCTQGTAGNTGTGASGATGVLGTDAATLGQTGGDGGYGGNASTATAGTTGDAATTGSTTVAIDSALAGGDGGNGGNANGGAGGSGGWPVQGGNGDGGNGGSGGDGGSAGAGGNGGNVINGSGFTIDNSGTLVGGTGGAGGNAFGGTGGRGGQGANNTGDSGNGGVGGNGGSAGNGGSGGNGVDGSDFQLTNLGTITGGHGGSGGIATGGMGGLSDYPGAPGGQWGTTGANGNPGNAGIAGAGGIGVVSTGGSTITTAGVIAGGLSGDNATRADAVRLSGGDNTLTLENGYSFTGNVVSNSGAANGGDTLALGGDTDPATAFDVSHIVSTAPTSYTGTPQYYGFTAYKKTGTSTWTLTGAGAGPAWQLLAGTLQIGDGTTTSSVTGATGIDGAGATNGTVGGNSVAASSGTTLTVMLSGTAQGGNGGESGSGYGGSGGAGVNGASVTVSNSGVITAGDGGYSSNSTGGNGGNGVSGSDSTVSNSGAITAGDGGYSASTTGGNGGYGVGGSGTSVTNNSVINGGAGGDGYSNGGNGGGGVSGDNLGLTNNSGGSITGGAGGVGNSSGMGGNGASGNNLRMTNAGAITGGVGGESSSSGSGSGRGGTGGAGISGDNLSLTSNSGSITGGAGGESGGFGGAGDVGGHGGNGISGDALVVTNRNIISGGAGGSGHRSNSSGGSGGDGISGPKLILTNNSGGTISGGKGGIRGGTGGVGGNGGNGVSSSELSLTNNSGSTITGGDGNGVGSKGGNGVTSTGNTKMTNAGTIRGGKNANGSRADAVNFSGGGNQLTLLKGYSFVGNVIGSANSDILVLGGNTNATFAASNLVTTSPTSWSGTVRYYGFTEFTKTGTSTWTLTGTTAVVTPWTISAGALSVSSDGNLGDTSGGLLLNGGTLEVTGTAFTTTARAITLGSAGGGFDIADASNNFTVSQALSGSGTLSKSGDGTLTLTGANTYTGGTTITAGTLQGDTASLQGDIVNNAALVFKQSTAGTFAGAMSGNGALRIDGGTTLVLDGNSSAFTGASTVQDGTLVIGSVAGNSAALGGSVTVDSGATLGGHGRIGGGVALDAGAHLAPGNSIGTLTIDGDLTAAQGSVLDFELGTPGATLASFGSGDSVTVGGNLKLDGATLNVSDASDFGPGLYRLFSYGGSLTETNGGISLGSTPTGAILQIRNLTGNKQINLFNATGLTLNLWNGNGLADATQMGGGDGTWSTTAANWTDANGNTTAPMTPQPGFAIFGGTAGTVTVDGNSGADPVSALGMQFASDGYTLTGDALTLVGDAGAAPIIRVGDGSAAGAAYTATINNVLAGNDGLTKADLGTLVLAGANTYTGGTTIGAGTLQIGNGGATGSITGDVLDNSTLAFDRSDDLSFAGAITGTGSLAQNGSGTLTLTGDNTYTGGTTITAGTLQGDTTSLQGNIVDNAALVFNQNTAGTFAGAISGSGSLTKIGSGVVTLSGTNSYAGGTTITAGTLQGDTISLHGNIADNAALVFNQHGNGKFAGTLSGNGTLTKAGDGELILNAINSFSGATHVQAGTLIVGDDGYDGASLGGMVNVASGATLGGFGTVGRLDLYGTLAPGHSIGTLHVAGDATFRSGSIYQVEITPDGQSDQLAVAGKISILGGTVMVLAPDGDWTPKTSYTIFSAGDGIDGQFDSIGSNLAFLAPLFSYNATSLELVLERNDVSFSQAAQTGNQKATADAAESLGIGNPLYDALVKLDAPTARMAFGQLSGEIHASTRTAIADNDRYVRDAVNQHLLGPGNEASAGGVAAWVSAWGHGGHHDNDGQASRLDTTGSGLLVGADLAVGASSVAGAVLGSGQATARIASQGSSAHVRNRHIGVYGSTDLGVVQLKGGAIYSWQRVDTSRFMAFGDFADTASSRYDAHTTQVHVDGSHAFALGSSTLAPFVNVAWARLDTPAIHENGRAALSTHSQRDTLTVGTLGLRGMFALGAPDDGTHAHISLGWQHAWGDVRPTSTMHFADGGSSFDITGVPVARNAAALSGGVNFMLASNVSVDATYSGQFGNHATDQSARMSLTWRF